MNIFSKSNLRIGIVSYTNTVPLSHYLPEVLPQAELVWEVPSRLGQMLAAGELDVAMLSSIELLRHPEYGYIPGIGICSDGPVRSVCLYSKTEMEQVQTVALDLCSLSSVMMTRILMEEYWKKHPQYMNFRPPLAKGLQKADAAVTIGDATLREPDSGVRKYDLGSVWKEWSGLPFVYAVWITRAGIDPEELREPFEQAKVKGLSNLETIIPRCTEMVARPYDYFVEYFTQCIRYDVGEREKTGMRLFFEKAKAHLGKVKEVAV